MPPIEVGASGGIGPVTTRIARPAGGDNTQAAANAAANPALAGGSAATAATAVETSDALEAGSPPIDADRVAAIRQAVQSGTYPIVPTKISDAMIAAGMLLRSAN